MPEPPPQDALAATLRDLVPQMAERRRTGLVLAVLIVFVAAGGTAVAADLAPEGDQLFYLALPSILAAFALFGADRWVAREQQALVLPHLARAVDLTYRPRAQDFLASLPKRLLPSGAVRRAEDLITGTIGGRPVAMAEVKVETGGKNSSTLFRGVVARMTNEVPLPAFFLAVERQTKGWLGFSGWIRVDDLVRVDTIAGRSGEVYGIWLSQEGAQARHPALAAVIGVLTGLETTIGPEARLFSVTSTGQEMHIALAHDRDLFHFGGLFQGRARVAEGIERAAADLGVPVRVVSALIAAEARAAESAPQPA